MYQIVACCWKFFDFAIISIAAYKHSVYMTPFSTGVSQSIA